MAKGMFCDDQCKEAFAEDRRYGLIYGPYRFEDGTFAMTWEQASEQDEFCAYCGPGTDLSPEAKEEATAMTTTAAEGKKEANG